MTTRCLTLLALLCFTIAAQARDIHVDPSGGDDRREGNAGEPVRTIARGLKLAQPGDTVHLTPAVYRESAVFVNRRGEPGRPITLDGHGATISGAEPLDPAAWSEVSPGLFRCDKLLPRIDDAILARWFFRFGGLMQHMGRTSKGTKAAFKQPGELAAGEWTFIKDEQAFYVRVSPGQTLADARIEAPLRSAGVQISGDCAHLVIRDLTATHVYNDGFNIHGKTRDVRFENIRAIECGDDGISAHDDCRIDVDGFVSIGNSTGACHTNASVTTHNRCEIRGNHAFDFYVLDTGSHALTNSVIEATAARSIVVTGRANGECRLKLDNVAVVRRGGARVIEWLKGSVVEADRLTVVGMGLQVSAAEATLRRSSIFASNEEGITIEATTRWRGEDNVYQARFLRLGADHYAGHSFAAYQQATSDTLSRWVDPANPLTAPGAPGASTPSLPRKAGP